MRPRPIVAARLRGNCVADGPVARAAERELRDLGDGRRPSPRSRIRGSRKPVIDVHGEVDENDDDRDEEDPALEHRVVAVVDRFLHPRSHSWDREDRL